MPPPFVDESEPCPASEDGVATTGDPPAPVPALHATARAPEATSAHPLHAANEAHP